jgi:hypothetical protein
MFFKKYVQFKKKTLNLTDFNDFIKDIDANLQVAQYKEFYSEDDGNFIAKALMKKDNDKVNVYLYTKFQDFNKSGMATLIDHVNHTFLEKFNELATKCEVNFMMLIISKVKTDLLDKMLKKDKFLTGIRSEQFYYNIKYYIIEDAMLYEQHEPREKYFETFNYSNWQYKKLINKN